MDLMQYSRDIYELVQKYAGDDPDKQVALLYLPAVVGLRSLIQGDGEGVGASTG